MTTSSPSGISLSSPVTITPPALTQKDGTVKNFPAIIIKDELDYVVTYDNAKRLAFALIKQVNHQVTLWSGAAYDAAGEFTDTDVNNRLIEILGSTSEEISASLQKLYKTPPVVKPVPATPAS
jgi:hypothetical protein